MILASRVRIPSIAPYLVCLALAACGRSTQVPTPDSGTGIELFVPPHKSLYVEPGMPLAELLERYTQLMGWSLLVQEGAREKLAARHCEFSARLEVPFNNVHGFVEELVRANGLFLRFEHASNPVVLQVVDPDDKQQGDIPANRVLVPLAEAPRWEAHPAHMIHVQAPLPAGDTQVLVGSLRAIFGETARGVVQQAGETNTILFSGTGREVARLVRVLGDLAHAPPALPPALERTHWIELLRTPEKGLQLETDPATIGLPISALVAQYAQRMGWQLFADDDVRGALRVARLDAHLPLEVPPENVHAFVEGVLRANNFILEFMHASEPVLLRVTRAEGRGERLRSNAMEIESDELPRWAGHPDFLVRTRFNLPGVDARTLSNGLRQLFDDNQRQQILTIGTDGLLVTGYASEVARLSQLFRKLVDEAAGAKPGLPPVLPEVTDLAVLANPAGALHLGKPERSEACLLDLVDAYAQNMGWELLMGSEARNQLRVLKCGIALPIDVPAERVHAFVQGILKANDFVLSFANTQGPVLLLIQSTNSPGMSNPRNSACFVRPADIPRWAAHPDFLITTLVDLPGVDVRTLSNSLRQMFSDQQTQQIIPLGNSESLLVTGFADEVAALTRMFRMLVDSAAGKLGELPAALPARHVLDLFAVPSKPLHLENPGKAELKLTGLVEAYAQLMGWRLLVSQECASQLRQLRCGFTLPVDVPPERVHAFVEGVLHANDFVMGFAHAQEPVLLTLSSTNAPGKGNPRQDALFVPASDLSRWSAHPDVLVTTLTDLPGVDVRTLSNSLRQMFSDQQTQQIIPVGDTNGLVVTGFGSDVAAIVNSFRGLVDAAAGGSAALPGPIDVDSGIELLVPPAKGLHFEKPANEDLHLGEFFEQYARALGWRILSNPDLASELRRRCTIPMPVDVPPENVHAFVEGVARANGFFFGFAHTKTPVLLRLESTNSSRRSTLHADAVSVPPGELAHWAAHPAFVISTCVDLPGIDLRILASELKEKFSDKQVEQVVALGAIDGLILTGYADKVAQVAASLSEENRKALADRLPVAPESSAAERARLFPQSRSIIPQRGVIEMLQAFGEWSGRPVEISEAARAVLETARRPATPAQLYGELVYPFIGLLLDGAGCKLVPSPANAPTKWLIDLAGEARDQPDEQWPHIELEDLTAWAAYCATPFRTEMALPPHVDFERVGNVFALLRTSRSRGSYDGGPSRVVQLWGTPREIQTAAGMLREAFTPVPAGGR